jgi:hypothetical protein
MSNNLLNLNYNGIQPYLTGALKELYLKIQENERLIQRLREDIDILKK